MTINITAAVTFCFVVFSVWIADLVCYHPGAGLDPTMFSVWIADLVCYHPGAGLDPTSPVSLTIAQ